MHKQAQLHALVQTPTLDHAQTCGSGMAPPVLSRDKLKGQGWIPANPKRSYPYLIGAAFAFPCKYEGIIGPPILAVVLSHSNRARTAGKFAQAAEAATDTLVGGHHDTAEILKTKGH